MPRDVSTFIHRAGRTARQGRPGRLSCLVTPYEYELCAQLQLGEGGGEGGGGGGQPGELTPLQRSGGRRGAPAAGGAAAASGAVGAVEPRGRLGHAHGGLLDDAAAADDDAVDAAPWEIDEDPDAHDESEGRSEGAGR